MREKLLIHKTISSFVQIGYNSFPEINSKIAQASAFSFMNTRIKNFTGRYIDLNSAPQASDKNEVFLKRTLNLISDICQEDFKKIPGSPIAYWLSEKLRKSFATHKKISDFSETRIGLITGDNQKYIRSWQEVEISNIGFNLNRESAKTSGLRWFPQSKGGDFRRWYGNNETIVDWLNDGNELQTRMHASGERILAHNFNLDKIFQPGITWTKISSGQFAARLQPSGFIFNDASANAFVDDENNRLAILGFLGTKLPAEILKALNPTLNFLPGNISNLPIAADLLESKLLHEVVLSLILISKTDWDNYETSWDFTENSLIRQKQSTLKLAFEQWQKQNRAAINEMKRLEEENNRLFIDAYGLQDELSPDVPEEQITLVRADREQDIKRLISYAIGCMMGRYSLDKEGLIYAHSGNLDFKKIFFTTDNTDSPDKKENSDASSSVASVKSVVKFLPDEDGIVPILNTDWGIADDATNRIVEFVNVCWNGEPDASSSVSSVLSVVKSSPQLEENLKFIAESLGASSDALPRDIIRKYLSSDFYKNHLQTYKRRPIYWLFSSGKLKAFQCLVYLHRYNEGTLSRMRTEYVIPLLGRLSARIEQLESDKLKASSTSQRKKLQKEQDDLRKQHTELMAFDEKLKNYADQKIKLDLDDGVKVNYAKFSDILAEVKAVTGGSEE